MTRLEDRFISGNSASRYVLIAIVALLPCAVVGMALADNGGWNNPWTQTPCEPPKPDGLAHCWWVLEDKRIVESKPVVKMSETTWKPKFDQLWPNRCGEAYCEGAKPPPLAVGPVQTNVIHEHSYTIGGSLQLAIETGALLKAITKANAQLTINGQYTNHKVFGFNVSFPVRCVPHCMELRYLKEVLVSTADVEVHEGTVRSRWRLEYPSGPLATCGDIQSPAETFCYFGSKATIDCVGGITQKDSMPMNYCGPCPAVLCTEEEAAHIEVLPIGNPCHPSNFEP